MNPETIKFEEDLSAAIPVLKALGESNRLRIFSELMIGDSCNCELKDRLDMPPNLLSHHLRILSEAGLVTSRRDVIDGRWIYYSVDRDAVSQWQSWFTQFLDPDRIRDRLLCGPEGQLGGVELSEIEAAVG